jgi:signal transduction histidine kinase
MEETDMLRKLMIAALAGSAIFISTSAYAQGTAAEAKAMLDKAVAAVKADKAKAIALFNNGTDGFKDRDLYPFCFNISDGITQAAPPSVRGQDIRTLKDAKGSAFGADIYKAVEEGKINEVSYNFPKPGATEPSPKVSFVTKVGDLGCGVGYYK